MLEVSGPDPWVMMPKTYIGLAKTKKLAELRSAGVSASAIAEQLGNSLASVYRLVQAKKVRAAEVE